MNVKKGEIARLGVNAWDKNLIGKKEIGKAEFSIAGVVGMAGLKGKKENWVVPVENYNGEYVGEIIFSGEFLDYQ